GDQIVAGRLVATVALVAVTALVGVILRRTGAPMRWALVFALLFLLYNLFFFAQYVAVDNPQWLAQAIMLSSVPLLLRADATMPGRRSVVACAALMVLAGLCKHNLFALPLAVAIWLLRRDRVAFAAWCGASAACAAVGCSVLFLVWGGAAFTEILGFTRTFSAATFRSGLTTTSSLSALIGVGATALHWRNRHPGTELLALFASFGVLFGLGQRLGNGVNVNAQFDALIGLTLLCGTVLGGGAGGVLRRPLGPAARAALLFALLVPPLIAAPGRVTRAAGALALLPRETAEWNAAITAVRDTKGPVLCEYLAVCFWANKPEELDFFAYGEKLRSGRDPGRLAAFIADRKASLIVVDRGRKYRNGDGRLPPPFPAMIDRNYVPARSGPAGTVLMVPAG
ncbi:MAG: hypothetical protein INR65_19640, partial [Gluconacetobacter diazotrophicus]|nr:hypothetical protein [Gluconacetobacter diazotrophicus]